MNSDTTTELWRAGWERRFITDLSRVDEWVKLYTEMGFEVKVVSYEPENSEGCNVCVSADSNRMRVVFTKKTSATGDCEKDAEKRDDP